MSEDLGRAVLALETDPTAIRQGLASARQESLSTLQGIQQTLSSVGKQMTSTGRELTVGMTVPIVAAGKAIFDVGAGFEQTLNRIVGLTDTTRDELGLIKTDIMALATETGRAPQELAEGFYFLASAGFNTKEALDVLRTSAMAAAAGLGSTQDVAKVLGLTINAYGHENITAAHAADILTAAVKDGTAEADEFAGVLGRVVPTAALLGVSFDQVTASLAGMTLSGLSADEAATSLNQVLVSLLKPTVEAEEALKGMGTSSQALRDELQNKGLLATLRDLEVRFQGNDEAAGKVFGNVRALRGVLALLGLDSEQLNGVFADTAAAQGDLARGYKETEGSAREMDRAQAAVDAELISLSDDVLPILIGMLKQGVEALHGVVTWFKSLPEPVRAGVIQTLALLAALGPLLIIFGTLIITGGALTGVVNALAVALFTKLIPAVGAATEAMVIRFAPSLWLAAAGSGALDIALAPLLLTLGLVVIAAYAVGTAIASIPGILKGLGDTAQGVADGDLPKLRDGLTEIIMAIPGWVPGMAAAQEAIGKLGTETGTAATMISEDTAAIKDSYENNFPPIATVLEGAAGAVKTYYEDSRSNYEGAEQSIRDYTTNAVSTLQGFQTAIETAFTATLTAEQDAEATRLRLIVKEGELATLDADYTKNHATWTDAQIASYQLRRMGIENEIATLKVHAETTLDDMHTVTALTAQLTSDDLHKNLTSNIPAVKAAATDLHDSILKDLQRIKDEGGPAAAAAQAAIVAEMARLGTLPADAYGWGWQLGSRYAAGVRATYGDLQDAADGAARIMSDNIRIASPAKKGPLSEGGGPEGWSERLGFVWIRGLRRTFEWIRAAVDDMTGLLRPLSGFDPGLSMALATVSGTPASMTARDRLTALADTVPSAGQTPGGDTYNISVPVNGIMPVERPEDIVRPLRQLAQTGRLGGRPRLRFGTGDDE